jgi:hypothetical protein
MISRMMMMSSVPIPIYMLRLYPGTGEITPTG